MYWTVSCNVAIDLEKLKEKYSAKECHQRNLTGEAERLTVLQQKLQLELNAQVVSVSLLSADFNRLTDEILVHICFICLILSHYGADK